MSEASGEESGRLPRGAGVSIAYRRRAGKAPTVVFLGGFASDMSGSKAAALDAWAAARGQAFLRLDYRGHGESDGEFEDGTIGAWKDDALAAIDALTAGPLVLVGSSMGGWIALLVALARPERVSALVGIAAAPDFTEDLIWKRLEEPARLALETEGVLYEPSEYGEPYAITRALIEDGHDHLLARVPFDPGRPVVILQGGLDDAVPIAHARELLGFLTGGWARMIEITDGEHRLSRPQDLALLFATIDEIALAPDTERL